MWDTERTLEDIRSSVERHVFVVWFVLSIGKGDGRSRREETILHNIMPIAVHLAQSRPAVQGLHEVNCALPPVAQPEVKDQGFGYFH